MVRRDGNTLVIAAIENSTQLRESKKDEGPPGPFQVRSYADLLRFPAIPATSKDTPSGQRDISVPVVDAIIMPTIRSADQISCAVELASRARCQLLTLHTDNLPSGLSSVLAGLKRGEATPLVLRSGLKSHQLLDFGAALPQSLVSFAARDISRKRNLGLLIGRMRGWTRMLLLDDDIRRLSIEKLSAAAALLDKYPVVGLQVNKYPDASVVGHARRLTGRRQEPFISGGSLLVDPQRINGFFPALYHEDWLCVINHLRLGEVAIGGKVGQLPYKPFSSPERARHEEFGDILASGLLWLMHTRGKASTDPVSPALSDDDYWREATKLSFWKPVLEQRTALIESIMTRFKAHNPHDLVPAQSLAVSQMRCGELMPDEFVSFTKSWLSSLAVWREQLSSIPGVVSVEKGLAELGILHIVQPHHGGPQLTPALSNRRRQAQSPTVGSTLMLGSLVGAASGALSRRLRPRARKSP